MRGATFGRFEAGAGVNRASRLAALRSLAAVWAPCAGVGMGWLWDPARVNRVLWALPGAAPARPGRFETGELRGARRGRFEAGGGA